MAEQTSEEWLAQVDACGHDWRAMGSDEAYPASTGRACRKCHVCELGWLDFNVNAPPPRAPQPLIEDW